MRRSLLDEALYEARYADLRFHQVFEDLGLGNSANGYLMREFNCLNSKS